MVRKGERIQSRRQIDTLIYLGCFRNEGSPSNTRQKSGTPLKTLKEKRILETSTPFEIIHDVIVRLEKLFELLTQEFPPDINERARLIAEDLIESYERYPDAMLGAVHLIHDYDYTLCHPLHISILVAMLCKELDVPMTERISIVCAALTENIAMNELQNEMQNQSGGITDAQRELIRAHPQLGAETLERAGIDDPIWLESIRQHHEKADGTGYPDGRTTDEIELGARLISICDTYSAMVSSRAYRTPMAPNQVLKELFLSKGKEFDETLSLHFIKDIGVYPPGACVKLINGESGIIIARQRNVLFPIVSTYVSPRGGPYPRPFRRDTSHEGLGIKSIIVPDPSIPINLSKIWFF
jgi:HD-GYP domain-containing protein (c-di-GMP phosphodiesterase class II)